MLGHWSWSALAYLGEAHKGTAQSDPQKGKSAFFGMLSNRYNYRMHHHY